jgi:acyl-CoA synthetase (AMP-forming)/AMP-acid ligase II
MSDDTEPSSLADIALRRAERSPDAPFILTIDEEAPYPVRTRTYGQMAARAARLASVLADLGVAPGEAVGCYL